MSGYITRGSLVPVWKAQNGTCFVCKLPHYFRVMSPDAQGNAVCQGCLDGTGTNPERHRGDGQTIVTTPPIGYDATAEKAAIIAKQTSAKPTSAKPKAQKYHAAADYTPANSDEETPKLNMGSAYPD